MAGPALDPLQLAELLVRAGAVRGMQLDINPNWPVLATYDPPARARLAAPGQRQQAAGVDRAGPGDVLPGLVGPGLHHHVGPSRRVNGERRGLGLRGLVPGQAPPRQGYRAPGSGSANQYPYPPLVLALALALALVLVVGLAPETVISYHRPPERLSPLPLARPGAVSPT